MRDPSVKRWPIIRDMLASRGLAYHHTDSFARFIDEGIPDMLREIGVMDIEHEKGDYRITFTDPVVQKPRIAEFNGSITMTSPAECRLRSMTYMAPIMMRATTDTGKGEVSDLIHVGDMPIMTQSKYCVLHGLEGREMINMGEDPKDPGGYFIINGSERVIVSMEDMIYNRPIASTEEMDGKKIHKAKIYSAVTGYRGKMEVVMRPDSIIVARIPGMPVDLPVIALMRALGLGTDKQIAEEISCIQEIQDWLTASFERAGDTGGTEESLMYIADRIAPNMARAFQKKRTEIMMDWGMLPHLGRTEKNRVEKARFLATATCRVIELKLGRVRPDDKDNYGNKAIKLSGDMLDELFRQAFRNMAKDLKFRLQRHEERGLHALKRSLQPNILGDRLFNALATGNWTKDQGVAQMLDRTSYVSTISHTRRIQSPLSKSSANYEARDVHGTHLGRICPSETPEGAGCGLVKNFAMCSVMSERSDPAEAAKALYRAGAKHRDDCTTEEKAAWAKVFVDGTLIGFHDEPEKLCAEFRAARRRGRVSPHTGICHESHLEGPGAVVLSCAPLRILRPLIILKRGRPMVTDEMIEQVKNGQMGWMDLVRNGTMDLVDALEEGNLYVALDERTADGRTHMEIYKSGIMGVIATIIPFPEHNQSPRNTYGSAMAKQAVGFPTMRNHTTNFTRSHVMLYPQKPMINSKAMNFIGHEQRAAGHNAVVAVLPFDGYNIEDAVVVNQASVDRGFGRSFFYRQYMTAETWYPGGLKDRFEKPKEEEIARGFRGEAQYRHLDEDGVARVGADFDGDDVLVGKTSPPRFLDDYTTYQYSNSRRRDNSVQARSTETGTVDRVIMTTNAEGRKVYKIATRNMRVPEIGDKFASRHSQKGVLGILAKAEDLPYTADGMSADILINPHAFPSRMTVGMLLESVCGKAACVRGKRFDGSAFTGEKLEVVRQVLENSGFKYNGKEQMYDGRTGKSFPTETFIGVVYYQRLQHMVKDKVQARPRGPIQLLTRQPTQGKAQKGGLRFGEMERDCIIAHGSSSLLKDRMMDNSDKTDILVCKRCGLIAYKSDAGIYTCRVCREKGDVRMVAMSYAFKVMLQEIQGLSITPRLVIGDFV